MPRAALIGSAPDHAGYRRLTAVDPAVPVQATIVLRRDDADAARDLLSGRYDAATRAPEGTDAGVLTAVTSFARAHGLTVVESNSAERRVAVRGAAGLMGQAFGVSLAWFESTERQRYLSYEGDITLPAELAPHVLAVLGLDQRPTTKPRKAP